MLIVIDLVVSLFAALMGTTAGLVYLHNNKVNAFLVSLAVSLTVLKLIILATADNSIMGLFTSNTIGLVACTLISLFIKNEKQNVLVAVPLLVFVLGIIVLGGVYGGM